MTTPTPLTFEVGKTYVTRCGETRKVVHIFDDGTLLCIFTTGKSTSAVTRRADGTSKFVTKDDLVAEYHEPVIKKCYTNVVQKVGGTDFGTSNKLGCFQLSGQSIKPFPYINNNIWEHRAVLEIVITDDEVSVVNIIRPD